MAALSSITLSPNFHCLHRVRVVNKKQSGLLNLRTLVFPTFLFGANCTSSSKTGLRRSIKYPDALVRCRIPTVRCVSDKSGEATKPNMFGEKREFTGLQSTVDAMPPPVRIASSFLIVAAAIAAGYGMGNRFGGSRNVALGAAAVVGAAGAGAAYAINACVPEIAAARLHNYVVGFDDPSAIKKEDIEVIANKYGVSKQNESFNSELCDIYLRFVSAILPPGNEDLKGDEIEAITKFKNSLGIDDPDAASMHMEIGRRIFRQRLETDGDLEQRRAFQKLIYVSNIVFGDASGFLLPWKRVFRVTDSQVEVAVRDNAQRLYASKLESMQDVDVSRLISIREAQLKYRLSDEVAGDMFREHIQKLAGSNISAALHILKSRTGTRERVVEELDKIVTFSNQLVSFVKHPEASRFARGIGPVSFIGGEYDSDRKMDDFKRLYQEYFRDALSGGRMEESKLTSLHQLRDIFGLGRGEAESIALEVTSQVYRKRLQQAVSSGDLKNSDSKAAYLHNLCEELHFDPEKAIDIHEEIYRKKFQQLVADKGELSEEDVKTLETIQIMFCIRKQTVEAAYEDICGSLFEKVVMEAIGGGVCGYDAAIRKSVRKAAFGLRLTREAALSVASKAVRKIFAIYIQRARVAGSSNDAAIELKKLIGFNRLVATELVADIKGESTDTPPEENTGDEEQHFDEDEEWASLRTLRKVRVTKDKTGKEGQKEINLKDDLPNRDRTNLYKTYLLYCLTGQVIKLPLGGEMIAKKDDSDYVLLRQLGGILGLTNKEIVEVHKSLAEQVFRKDAEVILAHGQLTKSSIQRLNQLQKDIGLPPQYAQNIIKSITNTKLSAALETAAGHGKLSIKEIREMKENGVAVHDMISVGLRENLFKKLVGDIFSSGTGEFDEEDLYQKIPNDLNIDAVKAKRVVLELARIRLSNSLLQAVAFLRRKNYKGVVNTLNDLLACDKAVPSTPLSWEVPEELTELYLIYIRSDPSPEKSARMKYLLNISGDVESLVALQDQDLAYGANKEDEFVF